MNIVGLSKTFYKDGQPIKVLDNITCTVPPGSITVFMGPSGCGKTTLLRIIASLESPDSGAIELDDTEKGQISFLFQEPRLLPWKSVYSNVELVLRNMMSTPAERHDRAMHMLELVGLSSFARFTPDELSGGMRQRVAIARAFAYPARLMLLDEPFQSLDYSRRRGLLDSFLQLWQSDRRTVLFVTHETTEAVLAADQRVLLSDLAAHVTAQLSVEGKQLERKLDDPSCLPSSEHVSDDRSLYT